VTGGEYTEDYQYKHLATTVAFNGNGWVTNVIPNLPIGLAGNKVIKVYSLL
jgi:hypothetical protein